MKAEWKPPGYIKSSFIEWKARRLRDPVQKLAYLRRVAETGSIFSLAGTHVSWHWKMAIILLLVFLLNVQTVTDASMFSPRTYNNAKKNPQPGPIAPDKVWMVEDGRDYEIYSNGLRIENRFLTPNGTRSYVIFREGAGGRTRTDLRSEPAGIVFHTSESHQAAFAPDQNAALNRIGRDLLEYVSRNRAYHFVVDRFGRVFRVVPETDIANHAGYSVWRDSGGIYLNLNHSFLGISFEAETRTIDEGQYLSLAQIHSGQLLVQWLVSRYKIPLTNCVTHAQVSVDPEAMVIGDHTDGSGDFPFRDLGLPDNYSIPIPSLFEYGFDYDSHFMMSAGSRMLKGFLLAEERLRQDASSQHLTVGQFKKNLREKYQTHIATLKSLGIIKEK
jgi:hypothetical protein